MELLRLAYMYGHLFEVVCHDMYWSNLVIYILDLRDIMAIRQSVVLASFVLPMDFLSCESWLGELE